MVAYYNSEDTISSHSTTFAGSVSYLVRRVSGRELGHGDDGLWHGREGGVDLWRNGGRVNFLRAIKAGKRK